MSTYIYILPIVYCLLLIGCWLCLNMCAHKGQTPKRPSIFYEGDLGDNGFADAVARRHTKQIDSTKRTKYGMDWQIPM